MVIKKRARLFELIFTILTLERTDCVSSDYFREISLTLCPLYQNLIIYILTEAFVGVWIVSAALTM